MKNRLPWLLPWLLSLVLAIWGGWTYLDKRKLEIKDKHLQAYHSLIKELVEPPTPDGKTYLDRQIAVVFELRNFPEYAEVTQRILEGLQESWASDPKNARLITEIDLTLRHLEKSNPGKNP